MGGDNAPKRNRQGSSLQQKEMPTVSFNYTETEAKSECIGGYFKYSRDSLFRKISSMTNRLAIRSKKDFNGRCR